MVKDQSRFIVNSIHELNFHLVIAAVLVALTILLFIHDWRTTIIASLAIPASIVATYAFMYWMGYTLNNMTMLGLILAIGIVIDDAVVINENIFRHMEEHGSTALDAAGAATSEIALAVSATTLSLLVIFIPVVFMGGIVGRFFNSFGGTVAFAIAMSWFILVTTVSLFAATFYLFRVVGFDFVPRDDQSEFEVAVTLPEGYTLDRADRVFAEIEGRLAKLKGVTAVFSTIGDTTGRMTRGQGDVTTGTIYARLVDLEERTRPWWHWKFWYLAIGNLADDDPRYFSQFEVQREARTIMEDYPELRTAVQDSQVVSASGFRQAMMELNLRGPDLAKLQGYSDKVMAWMQQRRDYVDVDSSLSLRKPELRVQIDRERASDLGIPVQTIAATLNVLVGGEPVTKYKEFDEQYDVWLRAELPFRDRPEAIRQLMIASPKAGLVQLSSLATLTPAKGPATIDRFGMQRQVVVTANLEGNKALGDAVNELSQFVDSLNLPADYRYEFIGKAKMMGESNQNFLIAFLASFLFMYMILGAQFESFVHPITILLALPLTLPFALISLILLRTNLNIYAMFGLFMLFGIVKKNGILQVDYTNVLRAQGLPRDEAILEANHTRLRPILMTTVMLIAAMIPIALGQGPGAASRASLAKVILGGQTLSLLLTLLVTPVAYSYWDDISRLWWRFVAWVTRKPTTTPAAEPAPTKTPAPTASPEKSQPQLPTTPEYDASPSPIAGHSEATEE